MANPRKNREKNPGNQKKRVCVVIPAYNEAAVIARVLDDFKQTDYSVVVVDDCSSDNTIEIVSTYPVTLLQHMINLGQGAALQTGFSYVCKNLEVDIVVSFDADGQHDIKDIPTLIAPLLEDEFDVTLGSRFIHQKNVVGIPIGKLIALKLGLLFTGITTGLKLTDTHNGLRAFSLAALRKINITQNRMAHASELLNQIARYKFKYCEVPVTVHYTDYSKKKGQSIFNSLNILWDLFFGRD
jgi:glycosyltransferase involved in cell wall biosynthesis